MCVGKKVAAFLRQKLAKSLSTLVVVWMLTGASFANEKYTALGATGMAKNDEVELFYRTIGDAQSPTILVVMGLGASHRLWPKDLIDGLLGAGYRVILFDNRDTGNSSRMVELSRISLWWQLLKWRVGMPVRSNYSLNDMADDAVAVLNANNIDQVHLVGASMGGMIAQIVAYRYPERVLSLVSLMSTTGARHLPKPSRDQQQNLEDINESSEERAARWRNIGLYPSAIPNQITAVLNAGDRSAEVAKIHVPTLVQHGRDDPLLPLAHGEHTAQMVAGSTFIVYDDMAHNLPEQVLPKLLADMQVHLEGVR